MPVDDKANIRHELDVSNAEWIKTGGGNRSTSDNAIEYAHVLHTDGVTYTALRRPSDPADKLMVFTPSEWDAFVKGVADGEFDLPGGTTSV